MDIFEASRTNQIPELTAALRTRHPDLTDNRGSTPLMIAGYYNNEEATATLLAANASPDLQDHMGNTALMGACFKGYIEIARLLLDAGALVDKQNGNLATALTFAATFDRPEIIRLLLEKGANPLNRDKLGKNPVDYAQVQENAECYELLAAAANRRTRLSETNTSITTA